MVSLFIGFYHAAHSFFPTNEFQWLCQQFPSYFGWVALLKQIAEADRRTSSRQVQREQQASH
ncbi:hypothetical protein D0T11_20935 [Hymenobacter rubripertinctus]|uniref:Uncharacterized protein n=1 Tax=Hymenobacter rubripertinctus TaxID=2029981 RepID=A0A418QIW7_9BACT|nr:hypothetical protein D0T11_20935 [Hymenobacter rubripertinctus]